jgi:hypothetical protein
VLGEPFAGELAELRRIGQRLELRPFAFLEPDLLPQRIRHHQDVGEDDRRIELVAADRLQRDLDGFFRRVAEFEKGSRGGADGAILRQVAPGLAHQPDRRHRKALPGQGFEEFPAAQILSLMLSSYPFLRGSSSSRG